jgi:hypothetical protein
VSVYGVIILGLDALDLSLVKKYNCKNLMQKEFGQTDINEFELPRTVVLWASFLTGKNLEARIPVKTQWEFKLGVEETFFRFFGSYGTIDVPAFLLKEKNHAEERGLLKAYFEEKASVEEYDAVVWKNHEENRKDFFRSLGKHDLFMAYFDLADAIGHLSFGINEKMERVYKELEDLACETKSASDDFVLVVSDHGMKAVGRYGDHNRNGFYSANRKLGLKLPRITDFFPIIKGVA